MGLVDLQRFPRGANAILLPIVLLGLIHPYTSYRCHLAHTYVARACFGLPRSWALAGFIRWDLGEARAFGSILAN